MPYKCFINTNKNYFVFKMSLRTFASPSVSLVAPYFFFPAVILRPFVYSTHMLRVFIRVILWLLRRHWKSSQRGTDTLVATCLLPLQEHYHTWVCSFNCFHGFHSYTLVCFHARGCSWEPSQHGNNTHNILPSLLILYWRLWCMLLCFYFPKVFCVFFSSVWSLKTPLKTPS